MTKQVALAERTYQRLKENRRPGESFSKAIERLLDKQAKDPLSFTRGLPKPEIDPEEWLQEIEADRDASRVDA